MRGRKTGTGCTLGELARLVGVSHNHLRSIRDTAHHWPTRPGCRPRRSTSTAPSATAAASAGRRRDRLLETERYTAKSLRRWREAHAEYVPSRGARQAPIRQTELAEEIDALAGKVDRAIRAGAPP